MKITEKSWDSGRRREVDHPGWLKFNEMTHGSLLGSMTPTELLKIMEDKRAASEWLDSVRRTTLSEWDKFLLTDRFRDLRSIESLKPIFSSCGLPYPVDMEAQQESTKKLLRGY